MSRASVLHEQLVLVSLEKGYFSSVQKVLAWEMEVVAVVFHLT